MSGNALHWLGIWQYGGTSKSKFIDNPDLWTINALQFIYSCSRAVSHKRVHVLHLLLNKFLYKSNLGS